MNYLEKIENLNLPRLQILILNGNQIKNIENLESCPSLQTLEVCKNKLSSLGQLGVITELTSLKKVACSYNDIPLEHLDELILTLQNLPVLEDIDLSGNEVTLH